jgi:hypothetical protein
METKIGTMVRQSKNEGGDAHYKATADSARDTEKPYKLTATEKEALAKFEAASETRRVSKLTAIDAQRCLGEDGTHRASLDIVAWLTLKRRAKSAWLAPPSASAFSASRF